jgi:hypothetical protein
MGGLLSAEVILLAPEPPANRAFKHRILGTINLDVPFLGLHPGIVRSGLASIFKPSEETHQDKYSLDSGGKCSPQSSPSQILMTSQTPSGRKTIPTSIQTLRMMSPYRRAQVGLVHGIG